MNEIIIKNNDGELTVSSTQVAIDFGKEHRNVIQAIENLTAENSAVKNFFIESCYINERGRTYKCYDITRDGFSLLVMGFTGRKALDWKLKYIEAFNLMEKQLLSKNGIDFNIEELIVKTVTATVSETVKALVPLISSYSEVTRVPETPEPLKRICKARRWVTTPSKISMLEPELKQKVDEMIMSGEYSCQQIANFIMNNSDIEISQMAVNKYKHRYFV